MLQRASVDASFAEEIAMDLADGGAVSLPKRGEDALSSILLGRARSPEALGDARRCGAHIARPTRGALVVLVAEVSDELEHPARRRLRVAAHLVELLTLVSALPIVGRSPVRKRPTNRVVRVDERAAVDPELLERLLEDRSLEPCARRDVRHRAAPRRDGLLYARENLGLRIVPLQEKLVRLGVDERVEKHGT